jgi:signal transduction histidine kinase
LAVFAACEDGEAAAQTVALRSALVDAVAAGWSALAARRRAHADVERRLNARWRARLQRLVHEAGNPLAAVRSLLGLAMQRQDVEPTLRGQLGLMDTELARMAALLREGQGAEAGAEAAADGCRVGELLRELVALYGESLFAPGGRRLEREPAPADPRVRLPADTLRQVLANLLRNAAEALPPGGTCRLSVSDVVNIDGAPGVELRVADDGPGMTPAALAALFSAQTRGRPGNQGIGLAIVRELLARHGARIVCESRAGGGTLFRLLLPLADRPPAAAGGATRP